MKELTIEEREMLRQDILDRYDNEEYWNMELIKEQRELENKICDNCGRKDTGVNIEDIKLCDICREWLK